MKLSLIVLAIVFVAESRAQDSLCTFSVFAQIVDKNLDAKPIPKLKILLREGAGTRNHPFSTGFDGRIKDSLPCGSYTLQTPDTLEFQGKAYSWDLAFNITLGSQNQIELSNDNATARVTAEANLPLNTRLTDQLTGLFQKFEGSVVTVWSEFGHGTGFFIDDSGLVLTNQHVIGPSEYIAVQGDAEHKVSAVLLASDPEKDVAVLWVNRKGLVGTVVAPLAKYRVGEVLATVGERVLTIGSPLNQRKLLTTGIVSKVEERAILSDININHGNSGGPLFNSLGEVIGITTFKDADGVGSGISGIIRIEQAEDVISLARIKMKDHSVPSAAPLLVEPQTPFPISALKAVMSEDKFDVRPYVFEEGDYNVAIITPILSYRLSQEGSVAAGKEKNKRLRSSKAAAVATFQPLDGTKNWEEYLGEYRPVIEIRATPKLRETTGSTILRGLTARNGVSTVPAKLRFRADFYKMKLFCGNKEIEPIQPGKIAKVLNIKDRFVNVTDASYEGLYTYGADSISPTCGNVSLEIFSEKDVINAKVKGLNSKTIERVWEDFAPIRQ